MALPFFLLSLCHQLQSQNIQQGPGVGGGEPEARDIFFNSLHAEKEKGYHLGLSLDYSGQCCPSSYWKDFSTDSNLNIYVQ